jgi:hypothetical protein
LSTQALAQNGLEVLMGMVRAYHTNCPAPFHFWCATPELTVFAMADLYQASGEEGDHYIGCFLRGADFDSDGVPTIHEMPSLKAIMQPLDDGRVLVIFGGLTNRGESSSLGGLGLLDQRTAEHFVVTPARIPNVPEEPGNHVTFLLQRSNNIWEIAHFAHEGEFPADAQIQVFAAFPVDPIPSPLTILKINESTTD